MKLLHFKNFKLVLLLLILSIYIKLTKFRDLSEDREIIDFIFEYHKVVHNIMDDDERILTLYCRNYLNSNTYLEDHK